MKARLGIINWEHDYELPELDRTETYLKDTRYITFEYRGKELMCEVDIEINWTNELDAGDRMTPPYEWEEIQDVYISLGEVTDLEENYFKLSTVEKNIVVTELETDLKTQY